MRMISPSLIFYAVSAASAEWTFSWPYGEDGACRCRNSSVGLETFEDEPSCLKAFAASPLETCSHGMAGIDSDQCELTVAIKQGLTNSQCLGKCSQLIAGVMERPTFFASCDFEFVVEYDDTIALAESSCFSNMIYGWSDYDPSSLVQSPPLRIFSEVPSASRCQELCQSVPDCAHWLWRAFQDPLDTIFGRGGFQNEKHTCILRDEGFMSRVLSLKLPSPGTLPVPIESCDTPRVKDCFGDPSDRVEFNILEPPCFLCDCKPRCGWRSSVHVSGPAFCQPGTIDLCYVERAGRTTTTSTPTEDPQMTTEHLAATTNRGESTTAIALDTTTVIELETTTGLVLDDTTVKRTRAVTTSEISQSSTSVIADELTVKPDCPPIKPECPPTECPEPKPEHRCDDSCEADDDMCMPC